MFTLIILTVLFLAVPSYTIYRIRISGVDSVFNFSLYPLIFSYFYLLIPSLMPVEDSVSILFKLSDESRDFVDLLSLWMVFVFLIGYMLSKDRCLRVNLNIKISSLTAVIAKSLQIAISILMIVMLVQHGSSIYAVSADRGLSYSYYEKLMDSYKLQLVFNFAMLACVVGYIHNRSVKNYLPLILFCILDALAGGRGYTFTVGLIVYLSYLTYNREFFGRLTMYLAFGVIALFLSAFFRRYVFAGDNNPIFTIFGEFYFTRLTGQYAFDYLRGVGNIATYFLLIISKLLPQFLTAPLFNSGQSLNYAFILNDHTGLSYGLAGSLVSEAIYYGGRWLAFVFPIFMSSIYVVMNNKRLNSSLPGYVFFIFLASASYNIFRSSFFVTLTSLIYLFVFYFGVILIMNSRKRIFLR